MINITKVLVFAIVIAGGCWALTRQSWDQTTSSLVPFFPGGATGLFQAMGFTFIALQGFDLIAAVAGEIKNPRKTIPRAMILSLGAALLIYVPLLFLLCTVGVGSGETIVTISNRNPEAVVAETVRQFLGPFGYWLIIAAAILSMLSALQANLFAASRVAFAMARDRTLSVMLGDLDPQRKIPRLAVVTVSSVVLFVLLLVPDVATAGAASSLIFLITFALAHSINVLFRQRIRPDRLPFRVPLFPLVPIIGGTAMRGADALSRRCRSCSWHHHRSLACSGGDSIHRTIFVTGRRLRCFRGSDRSRPDETSRQNALSSRAPQ